MPSAVVAPAKALKLAKIRNDVRTDLEAANLNSLINADEVFDWVPNPSAEDLSSGIRRHKSIGAGSVQPTPKPAMNDDMAQRRLFGAI